MQFFCGDFPTIVIIIPVFWQVVNKYSLRGNSFFRFLQNILRHTQQTADMQRVPGAIRLLLHRIQAVIHVLHDPVRPLLRLQPGDLQTQGFPIQILQPRHLVVGLGHIGHMIVMGGQHGNGIAPI